MFQMIFFVLPQRINKLEHFVNTFFPSHGDVLVLLSVFFFSLKMCAWCFYSHSKVLPVGKPLWHCWELVDLHVSGLACITPLR